MNLFCNIHKTHASSARHWGKNTGSGNIVSTANDMARWMLALLNDGKDAGGVRVLRDRVVEEVFRPQNVYPSRSYAANYRRPVTPESFTGETYSLGWKNGYYKGVVWNTLILIVQELCESRGGRPGLSVLTSLLVSVDVKLY